MTSGQAKKTTTSTILESDDITKDDDDFERVQKTAVTRRLLRTSPKHEVDHVLGELAAIESLPSSRILDGLQLLSRILRLRQQFPD